MHPFTGRPVGRGHFLILSPSPAPSPSASTPPRILDSSVPSLHPSNTSNTFFLRFLNQTEITRAKLSPDTRIREFEKKFKSECAKSNHVRPPSSSRAETKCRLAIGTRCEKTQKEKEREIKDERKKREGGGESLLKRGINYTRIPY